MLDIKYIREHPKDVEEAARNKQIEVKISHLLEIDAKYREVLGEVQQLRQSKNIVARKKNIEEGRKIKEALEKKEVILEALKEELNRELLKIPNPAKTDVKVGRDDSENEVIRKHGEPRKFDFKLLDHMELGRLLDIIDVERAAKVSGSRFGYLKNEGALLEFALEQFAFDLLLKEGFIPVIPPVLIKQSVMRGLGYMENGGDEDMYLLQQDNLVLVGTAEHALVPLHMNETLAKKELPRRYAGVSSAFRREAGSYGKDTHGIFRVHQFNKVEMVSFVAEGEDDEEHEYLLSLEEKLFQTLDIPYQVKKMCTGELGFPAARKYDIETWIPSQEKYREVTSVSTVTDFQSRRLNIRYQDGQEKKYAYVLNGTAFSMNRPIIALLENYQEKDGSVIVPEILRKYMHNLSKISPKKQ